MITAVHDESIFKVNFIWGIGIDWNIRNVVGRKGSKAFK